MTEKSSRRKEPMKASPTRHTKPLQDGRGDPDRIGPGVAGTGIDDISHKRRISDTDPTLNIRDQESPAKDIIDQ
jgi:hypothetical protein